MEVDVKESCFNGYNGRDFFLCTAIHNHPTLLTIAAPHSIAKPFTSPLSVASSFISSPAHSFPSWILEWGMVQSKTCRFLSTNFVFFWLLRNRPKFLLASFLWSGQGNSFRRMCKVSRWPWWRNHNIWNLLYLDMNFRRWCHRCSQNSYDRFQGQIPPCGKISLLNGSWCSSRN